MILMAYDIAEDCDSVIDGRNGRTDGRTDVLTGRAFFG